MADAPDAERLYVTCQPQLIRYLTRMIGNAETARDLAQETFLRATRATGPIDEPGRRAWLFRIARHLALNHLRDRSRHAETGAETSRADQRAGQETAVVVHDAIAQLAQTDREVFLLRESAGLSYAEIAEACALSEDAVRARLQRARQALRALLAGTLATERDRGTRFSGRDRE